MKRNIMSDIYEPIQLEIFCRLVKSYGPDLVVDVGANVGLYGLMCAEACPNTLVHLVEASVASANECRENIRLNQLETNVELHSFAASDTDGSTQFLDEGSLSGRNSISATSIHDKEGFDLHAVETKKLDSFIKRSDSLIAIKIDTEGHEEQVISGAARLLTENRAIVQCETIYKNRSSLVYQLTKLGYTCVTSVGPDSYFTNLGSTEVRELVRPTLEEMLTRVLEERVQNARELSRLRAEIKSQKSGPTFTEMVGKIRSRLRG